MAYASRTIESNDLADGLAEGQQILSVKNKEKQLLDVEVHGVSSIRLALWSKITHTHHTVEQICVSIKLYL